MAKIFFNKFDELEVHRVNAPNPISVICLNECWLNANDSLAGLNLQNYQSFFQPGDRVGHGHCGLVTYIHNQFNATDITDSITVEHTAWDYMNTCVWKYLIKSLIRKSI